MGDIKTYLTLTALILASPLARAEDETPSDRMGLGTHSSLIQKLELAVSGSAPLAKKSGLHKRLADLYADRARLQQMEEVKAGCTTLQCSRSKEDRQKAIQHYASALPDLKGAVRSETMIQKAFLHDGLEQSAQAKSLYNQIKSEGRKAHEARFVGMSHTGLGELAYKKADFREAIGHFQNALNVPETPRRSTVRYRMAWSQLNSGQTEQARNTLEKALTLSQELKGDTAFQEDMVRDLASFYARSQVGPREIEKLQRFAPAGTYPSVLRHLAEETDRLGNKKASIYVWGLIPIDDSSPFGRAEKHLQKARLFYEAGEKKKAATEMQSASLVWNEQKCSDKESEKCAELKKQIREFIVNWNKGVKVEPDQNLLSAYLSYSAIFPTDFQMHYWAGQLAKDLKNFRQAADSFRLAAIHAKGEPRTREGALLNQIEAAEILKNNEIQWRAYSDYLEMNPQGAEAYKVRYQMAHIKYDARDYKDAALRFFELVKVEPRPAHKSLRVQSADLALDALAALKDDERLEEWAQAFAQHIPSKKVEYYGIARKAALNQIAMRLSTPTLSNLRFAREKMNSFPMTGITNEERTAFAKNQIVLGEKLHDLGTIRLGARNLLSSKPGVKDRELALSRIVWCFEMELNFREALKVAKTAGFPELGKDARLLKLAVLAEFAGSDPRPFYEQALKVTKGSEQQARIRQKLVRRSSQPWKELQAQKTALMNNPDVFAESLFETYARKPDANAAATHLRNRAVLSSPSGQALARVLDFGRLTRFHSELSRHRLARGSDAALGKSLNQRLQLLADAERELGQAGQHQDWSRQVLMLSTLQRENARLAHELRSLPVPRVLRGAQREQYKEQLGVQAQKYDDMAKMAGEKLEEFTRDREALTQLASMYEKSDRVQRRLLRAEISTLRRALGASGERLETVLAKDQDQPTAADVQRLRQDIQTNPYDTRATERLMNAESARGNMEFAAYLEARVKNLQGGAAL